jgi:hypothetical protein
VKTGFTFHNFSIVLLFRFSKYPRYKKYTYFLGVPVTKIISLWQFEN